VASLLATPFRPFAISTMHTMVRFHSGARPQVAIPALPGCTPSSHTHAHPTLNPTNQAPNRSDPQAMETAFLQRASKDTALSRAQRLHSLAGLAGMALFFVEDSVPHIPFVHCSWHLCSAAATNSIHALLKAVEEGQQGALPCGTHDSASSLTLPAAGKVGCGERGVPAAAAAAAAMAAVAVGRELVVSPLQLTG